MTGKEKKYQLVRRYDLIQKVLVRHISELQEKVKKNMKTEAESAELSMAIRSWLESEESQLLSNQMVELDEEIIRFNKGMVTGEQFVKFLTTTGSYFITNVVSEKCRLSHRLELCNLLETMYNLGEHMPKVINESELAKYFVDC